MRPLRALARRFGYDLVPRRKPRELGRQLDAVLERAGITLVLDVGANRGQYAQRLRQTGYRGRIVSFEPLRAAHAALTRAAQADPLWQVAPRTALGAASGEVEIQVSSETDMSSILAQSDLLRTISPTSRVTARERVRLERVDGAARPYLRPDDRVFLKVDTQGYEQAVLAGAAGILEQVSGLQLELSLVPLYQGEAGFREMLDRAMAAGFEPHLILPGYFERKLARQLQVDVVFMRPNAPASGASAARAELARQP